MNKNEFVRAYADKLGVTIKQAEDNVDVFIETLTQCLKNGEYVHVSGFATFELVQKAERDVHGPADGKIITIPECVSPKCRFSKTYKEEFNK